MFERKCMGCGCSLEGTHKAKKWCDECYNDGTYTAWLKNNQDKKKVVVRKEVKEKKVFNEKLWKIWLEVNDYIVVKDCNENYLKEQFLAEEKTFSQCKYLGCKGGLLKC